VRAKYLRMFKDLFEMYSFMSELVTGVAFGCLFLTYSDCQLSKFSIHFSIIVYYVTSAVRSILRTIWKKLVCNFMSA